MIALPTETPCHASFLRLLAMLCCVSIPTNTTTTTDLPSPSQTLRLAPLISEGDDADDDGEVAKTVSKKKKTQDERGKEYTDWMSCWTARGQGCCGKGKWTQYVDATGRMSKFTIS